MWRLAAIEIPIPVPQTKIPSSAFWQDVNDAEYALNGAVADIRYLFDRDCYLEAMGEYVNVSGNVLQNTANNEDPSEALRNGAAYDGFYVIAKK